MATTTESPSADLAGVLDQMMHPYRGKMAEFSRLPASGLARTEVLDAMRTLRDGEEARWKNGFASGAVYNGDEKHVEFVNRAYALHSQSNPLHTDSLGRARPSSRRRSCR